MSPGVDATYVAEAANTASQSVTAEPPGHAARRSLAGRISDKSISILYVALVACFLAVGIVQTLFPIWQFETLDERREPTVLDDYLTRLARHDPQLPATLSGWFDDKFGFRAPFIRLYNEMEYRLFNVSAREYIGENDFLFEKRFFDYEIKNSRSAPVLERNKELILKHLRNLNDYLARRGIKLVIVPIPSKGDFYREYLPISAPRLPERFLPYEVEATLKNWTNIIYVDANAALRAALDAKTAQAALYYRSDPHLNFWGALAIGPAIANSIAADARIGMPPWRKFSDYYRWPFPAGSDQRFLGLFGSFAENILVPKNIEFPFADTNLGYWEKDPNFHGLEAMNESSIFEYTYRTRDTYLSDRLPPVVIYGDSFADHFALAGLQDEFAAVYRSRENNRQLKEVVDAMPQGIKYFLLIFNEGTIDRFVYPLFDVGPTP
ncbi:MAG: hypothetical protein JO366_03105 [Methylobacteriaceae bacterium]|nr:hypothetical protein [Methylobacteriaceae bacterium]